MSVFWKPELQVIHEKAKLDLVSMEMPVARDRLLDQDLGSYEKQWN